MKKSLSTIVHSKIENLFKKLPINFKKEIPALGEKFLYSHVIQHKKTIENDYLNKFKPKNKYFRNFIKSKTKIEKAQRSLYA